MMGHKGLPSFAFLGHHEPGGALQTPSVRRRHEQRHYLEFRGGGDRQQLQKHRLPRSIGRSASPNFCELVHRLTSTTNEGYGPATRLGSLKTANTHKHHLNLRVCAFTWLRPFGKARPGDSASGSTSSPLPSVKFRSFTPLTTRDSPEPHSVILRQNGGRTGQHTTTSRRSRGCAHHGATH